MYVFPKHIFLEFFDSKFFYVLWIDFLISRIKNFNIKKLKNC